MVVFGVLLVYFIGWAIGFGTGASITYAKMSSKVEQKVKASDLRPRQ